MRAKFAGKCSACGIPIAAGESCDYEKGKGIRHYNCPEFAESDQPETQQDSQIALATRLGFLPHEEAIYSKWLP